MLKTLLHCFVAKPSIYNLAQWLAGINYSHKRIAAMLAKLDLDHANVLDIGGGTGLMRNNLPDSCAYTCLDNDPQKFEGISPQSSRIRILHGDATAIPVGDQEVDLAILSMVSHHLTDNQFDAFLQEACRILKPNGRFLFIDGLWEPKLWRGRFLWSVDRGSNPRTYDSISERLGRNFSVLNEDRWIVHHAYVCRVMCLKPSKKTETSEIAQQS